MTEIERLHRPDFGSNNLKLHLRGRAVHHMNELDLTLEDAGISVAHEIANLTDVRFEAVRQAARGKFTSPTNRTKIWCALGMDPGSFGFRLVGTNGQEVLSKPASPRTANAAQCAGENK